jgi:CBS domain-containing protein
MSRCWKELPAWKESKILEAKLEDVASKPLVSARPGITFRGAVSIMKLKKTKRLPILECEQVRGIITARDLVDIYSKSTVLSGQTSKPV